MTPHATTRGLARAACLALALCLGLAGCAAPGPQDGAAPPVTHALGGGDETDGGLGGTGILGTITGFGSIHLNGLRLRHAEEAEVASALGPSSVDTLEAGEVLLARARETEDGLRATRLARYLPLVGPVTAVDLDARTLRVLGVSVAVPEDAVIRGSAGRRIALDGLGLRARVAVSGFWDGGQVVARHLRSVGPGSPDSVSGPVALDAEGRLAIGGVPLAPVDLRPGARTALTAIGRFENGRLAARRIETGLATPLVPGVTALSVQGYARADADGTWLSGQPGIAVQAGVRGRFGLFEGRVGALGERAARRGLREVARRGLRSALGEGSLAERARDALRDRLDLAPAQRTRSAAPPADGRRDRARALRSIAPEVESQRPAGQRPASRRDSARDEAQTGLRGVGRVGPAATGPAGRMGSERGVAGPTGRGGAAAGPGRGAGPGAAGPGAGRAGPGAGGPGAGGAEPAGGRGGAGPSGGGRGDGRAGGPSGDAAGPGGTGRGGAGPAGGRNGPGPGGGRGGGRGGGPAGGAGPGGRS